MANIIFKPITKDFNIIFTGERTVLPSTVQVAVDNYWQGLTTTGKTFTRGDIFNIKVSTKSDTLLVKLTDYAPSLKQSST